MYFCYWTPRGDEFPKGVDDDSRVVDKPTDDVPVGPAAAVLQELRQVPVIQGGDRTDAAVAQSLDQATVKVETLGVGGTAPLGLNTRPCDRKAIDADTEFPQKVEV